MKIINRVIAAAGSVGLSDGMLRAVLPLLVTAVTLDPSAVAAVSLFFSLPWLIVSIPFGPLVDRFDPVLLMRLINVARLVSFSLLVAAVMLDDDSLLLLYTAAFVLGSAETLYEVCAQVVMPRYVEKNDLSRKNGHMFGVTSSAGGFIGPALGGILLALGALWAVGLSAVGYAVGLLILLTVPLTAVRREGKPPRFVAQIKQGFAYLKEDTALLWLAVIGGAATICWYAWTAIFVLAVLDAELLNLDPAAYGIFLAVLAAGSVLASLIMGRLKKHLGMKLLLMLSLAGWAVWFAAPGITSNAVLVGVALFIGGFAGVTWNVLTITLRQTSVPSHLLGRVTAVYRTITRGGRPLGALLGGVAASTIGLQSTFLLLGAVTALLIIPLGVVVTRGERNGWAG